MGSKYEVYVRYSASSHMQTFEQPFRTLAIKWEVNICKEVFLRRFFLCLPSCVFTVVSLWCCRWLSNLTPIWCLCQQSSSRIQNEPGYRKRQFLSITTRHQRKEQRKMLELKEVIRKNKNKQASIRRTDRRGKNKKKRRKEENNATCWKIRRKK